MCRCHGSSARACTRNLGPIQGELPPGPLNALTGVAGVRVGHTAVIAGEDARRL